MNHRKFQEYLKEMDNEYGDILYFTEVRWLSRGSMLKRFYELRNEINDFMVNIVGHLNSLNEKLQGKDQLVCSMYSQLKAFEVKLMLWHSQIQLKNFAHFSSLSNHKPIDVEVYLELINILKDQFKDRFSDIKKLEVDLRILQSPFTVDINVVPQEIQMEIIELQCDDLLKEKFTSAENLLSFVAKELNKEKYHLLARYCRKLISIFGSTYRCEQFFSQMKIARNTHRTRLTDADLLNTLCIAQTCLSINTNDLVKQQRQLHTSH